MVTRLNKNVSQLPYPDIAYLREKHSVERHTEEVVGEDQLTRKSLSSTMGASNDIDFETLVGQTQTAAPHNVDLFADIPGTPTTEMPALLDSVSNTTMPGSTRSSTPTLKPNYPSRASALGARKLPSPLAPPPRPAAQTSMQPVAQGTTHSTGLFDALVADASDKSGPPTLARTSTKPVAATINAPTPPPGWGGGILQPQRPNKTPNNASSKSTWADFDPLK